MTLRSTTSLVVLVVLQGCLAPHMESLHRPLDARPPLKERAVELVAVGDVLPHRAVLESARAANLVGQQGRSLNHEGFDALWSEVRPAMAGADFVLANLESPVAPGTGRPGRAFQFNAPEALLPGLKALGVNIVSVANNHSYDQGRKGLAETIERLGANRLAFVGIGKNCDEAARPRILEANGIRIAFMAASEAFNSDLTRERKTCAARLDEKRILRDALAAKGAGADLVVLSLHWGNEYQTRPTRKQVRLAHRLLEGGVDVILGHHPHVLQPVEIHQTEDGRSTLVAYSLGNFVSNQARHFAAEKQRGRDGYPRDGVVLRLRVVRELRDNGLERTALSWFFLQPVWTENNARDRRRDAGHPACIRVLSHDPEIESAEQGLATHAAEQRPDTIRELKRKIDFHQGRKLAAARVLRPGKDPLESLIGIP